MSLYRSRGKKRGGGRAAGSQFWRGATNSAGVEYIYKTQLKNLRSLMKAWGRRD